MPATRREARLAFQAREEAERREAAQQKQAFRRTPKAAASTVAAGPVVKARPAAASTAPRPRRRLRSFANVFAICAAAGIVGTVAIPAYALNPNTQGQGVFGASAADDLRHTNAQSVDVGAVRAPKVQAETFKTTSAAQIQAQQAIAAANKAQAQLDAYAAAYTGPSAADFLKNPPYPHFSLSKVFSVASKYQGVPYVYGGATPAGFDCSGFVMFVYAQFGISLPHSASAQGAIGTRIDPKDAQPGDVIVLDDGSHDGFYAGNGMILDAPEPGRSVTIRPLWTSAYYVVRYGIGK